jgi:hypothetical protein
MSSTTLPRSGPPPRPQGPPYPKPRPRPGQPGQYTIESHGNIGHHCQSGLSDCGNVQLGRGRPKPRPKPRPAPGQPTWQDLDNIKKAFQEELGAVTQRVKELEKLIVMLRKSANGGASKHSLGDEKHLLGNLDTLEIRDDQDQVAKVDEAKGKNMRRDSVHG